MGHKKKSLPGLDPYAKYHDKGYAWKKNTESTGPNDPLVMFTVFNFKCPCGHPEFSEWQTPFLEEAVNGQYCENPECSDREILKPTDQEVSSTPCAFAECKYIGKFSCHVCPTTLMCTTNWESLHAWTRKAQQCRECKTDIYPYIMEAWTQEEMDLRWKARTFGGARATMKHMQELCAKCKELGRNCAGIVPSYGSTGGSKRFYKRKFYKRKSTRMANQQPKEGAGVSSPLATEGHVTGGTVAKNPQRPRQWVRASAKLDKSAPTVDAKELAAKQALQCAHDGSALDQQVSAIKKKKKPKKKKAVAIANGQGKQEEEQPREQDLVHTGPEQGQQVPDAEKKRKPRRSQPKKDGASNQNQGDEELKQRALTNLVTSFSALETAFVPSLVK